MPRETKLDKSLRDMHQFKGTIKFIYLNAIKYHDSWETVQRRRSEYMDNLVYKKLPRWANSELSGYDDAYRQMLWDHLEGKWMLDGKTYTNNKAKEEAFEGRWSEVKYLGQFYPGTDIGYFSPGQKEIVDNQ